MLTDEALTGRNLKAADMLIDLMGESVQRENHALKRKELKLKEDAVKGIPEKAEEPTLYKSLGGRYKMTFKKLSPKQKTVFKWCYKDDYKAIICDGAVRSGKTICMITSFILWAMRRFDGATFGICGKTVRSAERNIIMPLQSIVDITLFQSYLYPFRQSADC